MAHSTNENPVEWPARAVVTAGMPYGNKPLHFGHVGGVFVPADAFARFLRDRIGKDNVRFVSGTDCFGSPINEGYRKLVEAGEFDGSISDYVMRNHSGSDTRRQEFYQFEGPEDFRSVIETRYRLIPYLYSEYMKAALNGDMLFKPLAFVYPKDEIALQTEDQLMLGNEVMIAPVYTQNATGRMVYLPEEMLFVKFGPEGRITQEVLPAGTHFVKVALNEVPLFIRKGACIPVADPAQTVADIDPATIRMIGWPGASYDRYDDDGVTIPAE